MTDSNQQLSTTLVQATAGLAEQNCKSDQKLDLLTDQIGRLTEVVTIGFTEVKEELREVKEGLREVKEGLREVRKGLTEVKEGLTELKAVSQQQFEVAKIQAQNVAELIALARVKQG